MRRLASVVIGLIALGAVPCHAQVGGTILGMVHDPLAQAVAGVEVVAECAERGVIRRAVTDELGRYRLVGLPPLVYVVHASAPGFAAARRTGTVVAVDSTRRIDFVLEIEGITQSIDVEAPVHLVQADTADLGLVVGRHRIEALPLNRRDFLHLALLAPGVASPVEGSELSSRGAFAMHANGGREEFNNHQLDGVDNNDPYVNRYVVQPSVDAIEEFKIATNAYGAEYGRSAAGQVNVVTRGGASRFEGFAYEYFRDEALDARNAFDAGPPAPFSRHQFGAGAGGPLVAARAFVFGVADVLRERQAQIRLAQVPTAAARAGDLSALARAIVDPLTGQPFPGNVIPVARLSPIAQQILRAFPLPNQPGPINYLGRPLGREDQVQGHVRVDVTAGPRHRYMARYSQGRVSAYEPYAEDSGTVPGFGDEIADRPINVAVERQHVVGDWGVMTTRLGYSRLRRDIRPENHAVDVGAAWGVDWLDVPARALGYPAIAVAGLSRIGDTTSLPILRRARTWHLVQTLAVDRGAHLVKLGGEWRHARLDGTLDMLARGSLSFSGALSGTGLSDLLLGFPSFALQARADNPIHLRSTAFGVFVQDDWRVTSALTVNAGLRYELASPPTDPSNAMATFDLVSGRLVPVGTAGVTASGVRADWNNVAPRLGVAWSLRPDTVVRAAYGLFFDSGSFIVNSAQYFNPPYFTLRAFFPVPGRLLTLDDPFPATGGLSPPATLSVLNPDLVAASMHHWNVAVERAVDGWGTARVAYAGSRGLHLTQARDLNQPEPGEGAVQARRPHPAYGSIFFIDSRGTSTYHALHASFDRPLARGWSIVAAYTLSRSMDENSALLDTTPDPNMPQDSRNLRAEWGPSSFDVRHRATIALGVELPQQWGLTRHTSVNAIGTFESGRPLTPVLRFDNSNTGNTGSTSGSDRPNLVGSPALDHPTAARWFDTTAFAVAPRYTFGHAGRNVVRGPGFVSVDVSVARHVALSSGLRLVFEAQAFNVLNRVNYRLPEKYVDEVASFGRIFSARAPRQVQLAVRLQF